MALSIIETKSIKPNMTKKSKVILLTLCLFLGASIFTFAFINKNNGILFSNITNQTVLDFFVNRRNDQLTNVMTFATNLASPTAIIIITALISLIWFIINREKLRPIILIASIGIAASLSTILKGLIKNSRPDSSFMISPFELDYSFPSGHTICIATLVIVISYLIYSRGVSWIRFIALSFTSIIAITVIAISRMYLGYHWATDILASVGLALVILAIVISVDLIIDKIQNSELKQVF